MKNFPRELINGNGTPMALDLSRLLLVFRSAPDRGALVQALGPLGLMLEETVERPVPGEEINNTATRFWVQARQMITDDHFRRIEEALMPLGLDFAGPVYRLTGERGRRAMLCPLPSTILVRLRQRPEGASDAASIIASMAATQEPQP